MQVNTKDAYVLARQIIERSANVKAVEFFGSTLKYGHGHDLDFILIVEDQKLWQQFWAVTDDINPKWPTKLMFLRRIIKKFLPRLDDLFMRERKQTRQNRASNLIGLDLEKLGTQYRPGTIIDVWLMPADWQSRIPEFTKNPNTQALFKSAAETAIKIA